MNIGMVISKMEILFHSITDKYEILQGGENPDVLTMNESNASLGHSSKKVNAPAIGAGGVV